MDTRMATSKLRPNQIAAPDMRPIPEGWFSMGYAEGRDDEKPVHRVWVDAFEIAAYQTTNEDYGYYLDAEQHAKPPQWEDSNFNHPKQPVVGVSWFDAVAYCEWMTRITGKKYRLPTEAEWEHAARAGPEIDSSSPPIEAHNLLYPWGNCQPEDVPNYSTRWKTGPEPVGLFPPNAYGIYNLGDNVHEWCADWYDAAYYAVSPERNPLGPSAGLRRASRGGSWRHHIKVTRTAARSSIPAEFKYADYGFRLARDMGSGNHT
jgi:sulfatase modifying factor 1